MLPRRFLTLLLALFFSLNGGAFARPNNEIPMYGGGGPYPPDMTAANEEFLAAIAKRGLSRPQGSDNMVQLGWQYYFQKRDVATAMKRLNQAWLLDPDNGDAFHGFAVLIMARDHDAPRRLTRCFGRGLPSRVNHPAFIWITAAFS